MVRSWERSRESVATNQLNNSLKMLERNIEHLYSLIKEKNQKCTHKDWESWSPHACQTRLRRTPLKPIKACCWEKAMRNAALESPETPVTPSWTPTPTSSASMTTPSQVRISHKSAILAQTKSITSQMRLRRFARGAARISIVSRCRIESHKYDYFL